MMIKRRTSAPLLVTALMMVMAGWIGGCTERDSALQSSGGVLTGSDLLEEETHSFDVLKRNDPDDNISRLILRAYATDVNPSLPQQPMPILYLLHDYIEVGSKGGGDYFERYNLQEILLDMFNNGEIGRMIVVTVDASNAFGGSYYRNASSLGFYEDLLDELIVQTERTTRFYTAGGRNARGISGHGMGGYGAMRYALDNSELFGSVSSMSGPLSFGDIGSDFGILSDGGLLDKVYDELGVSAPESAADVYDRVRAGRKNSSTRRYLAMAAAFSPHPLRKFDSIGHLVVPIFGSFRTDTIFPWEFFSKIEPGLVTVKFDDFGADTLGVGVDMLFDSSGIFADSIWSLWRDSADVKTTFLQKRAENSSFFDDVAIFIDCGVDNELGYLDMNRDMHQTLQAAGVAHEYVEYEGFGGVPAGHSNLVAHRLRSIIKFHDSHFVRPATPPAP